MPACTDVDWISRRNATSSLARRPESRSMQKTATSREPISVATGLLRLVIAYAAMHFTAVSSEAQFTDELQRFSAMRVSGIDELQLRRGAQQSGICALPISSISCNRCHVTLAQQEIVQLTLLAYGRTNYYPCICLINVV